MELFLHPKHPPWKLLIDALAQVYKDKNIYILKIWVVSIQVHVFQDQPDRKKINPVLSYVTSKVSIK